jgi:hypothetical protein
MSDANIQIPVDLTNPGQFFACCGLLELASRVDPNALGWFKGLAFHLETTANDVLEQFFRCDVTVQTCVPTTAGADEDGDDGEAVDPTIDPHRGRVFPMTLGHPFHLRLDWWTTEEAQAQKLKLWTAGQRVTDLLLGHHKQKKKKRKGRPDELIQVYTPSTREHFANVVAKYPGDWLRKACPIESPGAFSFDSRLSRNNALDLGHVTQKTLAFSPATDVLCLVAFQRFRPLTVEVWNRNRYFTWACPLPILVAPAAAIGMLPLPFTTCFEFPIKSRDAKKRYKLFGHAQPARRNNV